jgi:hypothetical protein
MLFLRHRSVLDILRLLLLDRLLQLVPLAPEHCTITLTLADTAVPRKKA